MGSSCGDGSAWTGRGAGRDNIVVQAHIARRIETHNAKADSRLSYKQELKDKFPATERFRARQLAVAATWEGVVPLNDD